MKEFVLMFRTRENPDFNPTPSEMKELMTSWMNWMGGIAARDKLANGGNRLGLKGSKVVSHGGIVADGPYTEVKEFINGYIIVKTNSLEEAVEIARECPMLYGPGNKVEVRPVVAPDDFE